MNSEPTINSQDYWDKRFQGSWQEKKGGDQTRFFAEILIEHLPGWFRHDFVQQRMSLCDWGCAEGEAVAYLKEIFPENEMTGVDFSETAIAHAASKYARIRFAAENWIGHKDIKPQYDVVLASNILEHFEQPLAVLRDVLGNKAAKYIVVLIPFAERPDATDPEHFFRFLKNNIPMAWDEWVGTYFEIVDTASMKSTRWQGQQAIVIYTRRDWIMKSGMDLTAANYPADIPVLEARLRELGALLDNAKSQSELAGKKLEMQLLHDKILIDSNNRLQQHCENLRADHIKYVNQIKDLEVAKSRLAIELDGLKSQQRDAEARAKSLENLERHWRETAGRNEKEKEELHAELRLVRSEHDELVMRHKMCALPREVEELQKTAAHLDEVLSKLDQLQARNQQLNAGNELLQAKSEQLSAGNELLQAKNQQLNAGNELLQAKNQQLSAGNELLQAKNQQLSAGNELLQAGNEQLQQQAEALRRRMEGLEQSRDNLIREQSLQQERLAALHQEKSDMQARNAELSDKILRLQAQALDLGNENARLMKDSELLRQIKGMYYYRLARMLDTVKYKLGLGRRRNGNPAPAEAAAAPRQAGAAAPRDQNLDYQDSVVVETMEERSTAPVKPAAKALKDFVAGSILDQFTEACFAPECTLLPFGPQNWKAVLEEVPIDFLFVESAWNGNKGAWQYRVGTYAGCPGRELDDVLKWCWLRGIPTVFWNKEDPPHFEKFIEAAGKFDRVFTTDANCIPRYVERLGHERVGALPFAAQPAIHNPLQKKRRDGNVCFAGTYYADDFEERRHDMDVLLRGSKDFGLDIYDRRFGYEGPDQARYRFPAEFQPHIRGRLDYQQMVEAYHAYRAFVNVNSVNDSPTMFSRRVFELLACGTPVVTTRSLGIRQFFGELVPEVASVEEVTAALDRLLNHPDEWWRVSALGIRTVMSRHTYTHRMKSIVEAIGLNAGESGQAPPTVVVVPGAHPRRLAECIAGQVLAPASVIVADTGRSARLQRDALKLAGIDCGMAPPQKLLQQLGGLGAAPVAFMDGNHYYGPNYLADAAMALAYAAMPISGLTAHFTAASPTAARLDESAGEEYFLRERVLGATVIAQAGRITDAILDAVLRGDWVQAGPDCYARSRFEFLHACPEDAQDQLIRQVCL